MIDKLTISSIAWFGTAWVSIALCVAGIVKSIISLFSDGEFFLGVLASFLVVMVLCFFIIVSFRALKGKDKLQEAER